MDFRAQPKRYTIPGLPVLAAALMLSAIGHAATNGVTPCEQVGRDLQSLAVPVAELAVDAVDHVPIDPKIIEESAISESVAPVLNLGPRVTSILNDIFDTSTEELLQESSEHASSSPVADSGEKKAVNEVHEGMGDTSELPRFQRQMRRTDI